MQKLLQRYKFMEKNLANNLQSYKDKVPTISRALTAVKHLVAKKEAEESIDLHFNLANNVYSEAVVKPEGRVALWLGVNVMLEYSYEEALELLQVGIDGVDSMCVCAMAVGWEGGPTRVELILLFEFSFSDAHPRISTFYLPRTPTHLYYISGAILQGYLQTRRDPRE